MSKKRTVHLLSLGCPKNRVDSEVMLGHLYKDGYTAVDDPKDAELIVVNTCAFIDSAKEESVDAILDMGEIKKAHAGTKLVVAGCLSQRYAPQLAEDISEVDHFLGTGNFEEILQVVEGDTKTPANRASLPIVGQVRAHGVAAEPDGHRREHGNFKEHTRLVGRNALVPYRHDPDPSTDRHIYIPDPDYTLTSASPRVSTLPGYTAYVKISEGCSNTCSFCIIPKLRGPQRSRSVEDIVSEVEELVARGVVELNLIAQDLCAYGKDLTPKRSLAQLLRAINTAASLADHPVWIRCLYAYPRGLTAEVRSVIAASPHIIPYLDIPLQHISDGMLRRMRRGKGGDATRLLVRRLREEIPDLVLRTTLITGMPGETEDDFRELYDFVDEMRFERLGVFAYSREADTPAATMSRQVDVEVAEQRRDAVMELQRGISAEQQEALIGQTVEVLVEGVSDETDYLLKGRSQGQAPDIDGVTYITEGVASPGEVVRIEIDQAAEYDVAGRIVEEERP